jgi:hypothetical protein
MVINKTKNIISRLAILTVLLITVSSCDPINCGIIENKTDQNIEIKIFAKNINEAFISEYFQIDTSLNYGTGILKTNEELVIAYGSRIAAPVMKDDLKFDKIELILSNDTLTFNKSAFYYCMNDRIDWPYFAVRNRYFSIK